MYNSLKRCSKEFHLFVFAFDDISYETLTSMNLDYVTVISLDDFETDELRRVKKERTKAEYCWTCTPSTIAYVIEKYRVPECTYLDADLYFFNDPSILINELNKYSKNVLISEHRFSLLPRLYEQKRAGRFCVQFMTFRNQESSLKVLCKWKQQCIDWCYAKHEDGKFGDQKYLDVWPDIYDNVHILENKGGGLAPWNISRYNLVQDETGFRFKEGRSNDIFYPVFYHFQYVKSLNNGFYDIGWYNLSKLIKTKIYNQYLNEIEITELDLISRSSSYKRLNSEMKSYLSGSLVKIVLKKYLKYNIMKVKKNGLSD